MKAGNHGSDDQKDAPGGAARDLPKDPWGWWRSHMPVAKHFAYLDHAAVAPLSGPAAEAIGHFAQQGAECGDTRWPSWASRLERLREQFTQLLGANSSEVCLVPNTTTGINLVAEGWPWQPGDSVVIPDGEFPSNLFPWQNQQFRGVELRVVPRRGGQVLVEDLIERVDRSTRMIAVSWVGYASGFRIDLGELVAQAHRRGVLVFLDAIQGLGMYPLDLQQIPVDFLAADGHKWLLGPEGLGVALIANRHLERIRCGNVGWNSVRNPFQYAAPVLELKPTAARFESGSANLLGAAALSASLEMFLQVREHHGDTAIQERVIEQTGKLAEALRSAGATTRSVDSVANRSAILTFEVSGMEPGEVRRRALERGVVVSCRDGGVRASVHVYNDDEDIARLVEVVRMCR